MSSRAKTALVVCTGTSGAYERPLLGLSIGERLLLALAHAGVDEVAFVGEGKRPFCVRADLQVVEADGLNLEAEHLVLAADTVFDRGLLSQSSLPEGIALAYSQGEALKKWIESPEEALLALGAGQAESGKDFAIRVDSAASAKIAQRALLLSLRKPIDGFVSTHLNRYVSLFCTRFLVKTGLPPNFFTILFTAIGLTAAVFATQAEYTWAIVLAGLLFQAQSILDGCDGEMARLTYQFSSRGQWFDSIGDDLTNYSVCFGLAIGQARVLGAPTLYWLGGAVLAMHLIASFVLYRRMLILGTGDLLAIPDMVRGESKEGLVGFVSDAISLVLKRDSFIFILSVVIVAQQPLLAFYLYGFGTIPMVVGVVLNDYRIGQAARSQIGQNQSKVAL
jgi:phosphatidylglycerophosphate synthase